MIFTKEKECLKQMRRSIDLFADLNIDTFCAPQENDKKDFISEAEKILKELNGAVEKIYFEAFLPVSRGDYLNIIYGIESAVITLADFVNALESEKALNVKTSCGRFAEGIINVIKDIQSAFDCLEEDKTAIKLLYDDCKKRIYALHGNISCFIDDNKNLNTGEKIALAGLASKYTLSLNGLLNALMIKAVKTVY